MSSIAFKTPQSTRIIASLVRDMHKACDEFLKEERILKRMARSLNSPNPLATLFSEKIGDVFSDVLSFETIRMMEKHGIEIVADVKEKTESELLELNGIGPKTILLIKKELGHYGLKLKDPASPCYPPRPRAKPRFMYVLRVS